jgi:hypothetical protein
MDARGQGRDYRTRKIAREKLRYAIDRPPRGQTLHPYLSGALPDLLDENDFQFGDTQNGMYVWKALRLIRRVVVAEGPRPVLLPSWILAYFFAAAEEIMDRAISDRYPGLTPKQRNDSVLEALGFRTSTGGNLILQSHRDYRRYAHQREIRLLQEILRLSLSTAARHVDGLKTSADPARKARRERRSLRSKPDPIFWL